MKRKNIRKICTILVFGIAVFSKVRFPNQANLDVFASKPQIEPISIYSKAPTHELITACNSGSQIEPISIY
ncbi:hypothetical protein [uncultured Anaerococcus sp.]|uniref:hypothetical protein n=1 Tax=Anaerococcus sp. AH8042_DFU013_CI05 TaxID=3385202 RepID=UPI0025DBFE91|nr:hypothetical protein [uncultured Anaerococcus sp.]